MHRYHYWHLTLDASSRERIMDHDGALPEGTAERRASQLRVIGEPISDESDDGLGEHGFGTTTTTSRVFAFGDDQVSQVYEQC